MKKQKKPEDPESKEIREKARMMVASLSKGIEDPEGKIPRIAIGVLQDEFGKNCVKDAVQELQPAGTNQRQHVAEVTLLESFDLGRNTAQNAGIEIKVFDKAAGKRGRQLGTIRIGQGSFEWWARKAKKATLRLDWSEFACSMGEMGEVGKRKRA
jgi:hypothetical protein